MSFLIRVEENRLRGCVEDDGHSFRFGSDQKESQWLKPITYQLYLLQFSSISLFFTWICLCFIVYSLFFPFFPFYSGRQSFGRIQGLKVKAAHPFTRRNRLLKGRGGYHSGTGGGSAGNVVPLESSNLAQTSLVKHTNAILHSRVGNGY